jgi:hypothetical protein
MRPVASWTRSDNPDGLGWEAFTFHLCVNCLKAAVAKIEAHPPFMEVMRYELRQVGIDVPPKAKYEEILARYNEHEFGTPAPDVQPALPQPEPEQPTIPEIRRMRREDLLVAIARYQLDVMPESMTREQMIDVLVRHFERLAEGTAA